MEVELHVCFIVQNAADCTDCDIFLCTNSLQCCLSCTVEGMDYDLPGCNTFSADMGNGASLDFEVTVNSDNLIECNETIVIAISDPMKANIMIDSDNSQYNITIEDVDGKQMFQ